MDKTLKLIMLFITISSTSFAENIISNNTGEHKLFELISYDTVFTVLITLFVFLLGIFFQKKLEIYKRNVHLKSIRNNFIFLIKILKDSYINPQTEQLKEFYQDANIDTGLSIIPPITISGDLKRLKEIQSNELFESFDKHYKKDVTKELHKLLSQIDFLIEQKSVIEKYHISIITQNNELRSEIQDLLEKYLDLVSDSIRDIKKENKANNEKPLWTFINQKMIDYYNKPDRNNTISYLYFNLLRPIQVELVHKEYDRKNLHAEKITRLGKTISTRRFYLKHQTISIKLQYRQFYNEMMSLKKDFHSSTEKIQNIK